MGFVYRKASMSELKALVEVELEVVRYLNELPETEDLSELRREFFHYYEDTLRNTNHVIFVCYDSEYSGKIVGVGGISFYSVMPTYQNLSGRRAQILNLYTHKDYKKRGIGTRLLELLVFEAGRRGVGEVILESTENSRSLFEKGGFVSTGNTLIRRLDKRNYGVPELD